MRGTHRLAAREVAHQLSFEKAYSICTALWVSTGEQMPT